VAAPADKRFRRAHVKPGRRRSNWRAVVMPLAKYALVAIVFVFVLYRLAGVAAQAHALKIDRIVVRGNQRLSSAEVLAVLSGLRGRSLVWADLDEWRRRLLTSPWVSDASLRRSLPSTVEVLIAERQPVGVGRIHGEMYLVDETGVIIDQYGPQYADLDLPIIDGFAARSADDGSMADEARAELAARVIAALKGKPDVARRLSQVDVSDLHNAAVILNGDAAVIQLGEDQFLQRLQSYLELASALRERVAEIDYVDLRFEDRIYVRPASRGAQRRGEPATVRAALRPGNPGRTLDKKRETGEHKRR
jgi:cell division protein FtsQ